VLLEAGGPGQYRGRVPHVDPAEVYRTQRWTELSRRIRLRDGGRCTICGDPATCTDHVVPVRLLTSFEAAFDPTNLRATCTLCNVQRVNHPERVDPFPLRREW